jgi:hypothetical protein
MANADSVAVCALPFSENAKTGKTWNFVPNGTLKA